MLQFFLITDTHYYDCEALGHSSHVDQITLNESGAIIDAAFDQMIAQTDTEIVLIAGDLSSNGERANHDGFIKKLRRLQQNGKRVYVITATHDYGLVNIDDAGAERRPGATYRNELRGLYNDFGFRDAIAEFEELSYVAQLAPGCRLLCLNDDLDGYNAGQLAWILEQVKKAREDGQFIFAMTHHPALPPTPIYPLISRGDMLGDYENTTTILADAGLRFIFTGHSHMQDVSCKRTESGNTLYHINTGALVGYDTPIRKVTVDGQAMRIETQRVESIAWDTQGKTVSEYTQDYFDRLLKDIFHSAAYDIGHLADIAPGFSVKREVVFKYRVPIRIVGKVLDRLTLGGLGRLCLCPRRVDKTVKGVKVKELALELVRNVYAGDEPYSADTPVGRALLAVFGNIGVLCRPWLKKTDFGDLRAFIASLLYDPTPDNETVLPLV